MNNRASLLTFVIILAGTMLASFYMVAPYILALLMGAILTLIIHPFYLKLRRRKLSPSIAAFLSTLILFIAIGGPLFLFISTAVKEAVGLSEWINSMEHISLHEFIVRLSTWAPFRYFSLEPLALEKQLRETVQQLGGAGAKFMLNIAGGIPEGILQMILACLACYCLLIDGPRFANWIFNRIPMDADIQRQINSTFKDTAISVVLASIAAAAAQALIMCTAFLALGVPNAFLAGGSTFILAWIPLFGSTPVWLAGAGYLYLEGSVTRAIMMLVAGIITGSIDNVVRPLVLKGRGEMHPLISLVAIFGGLQLFGLFGVFIGPILIALFITLLQVWPEVGHRLGIVFSKNDE